MIDLPSHTEFEYVQVHYDDGTSMWAIHPFHCVGYDVEEQDFIWKLDEDAIVYKDTEEQAVQYINSHGQLSEAFKNKLN